MTPLKTRLRRYSLDALRYSGVASLVSPLTRGVGVIFTLHHVRPEGGAPAFTPNRPLEVTTRFLERTIECVRAGGYEIVSLDEVVRRLRERDFARRFASFTFDDGYSDVLTHALPIFRRQQAPFALYITTGNPDGTTVLWWRLLEDIIRKQECIETELNGRPTRIVADTLAAKYRAFEAIYWPLRKLSDAQQHAAIARLADRYGVDSAGPCRASAISWDEIGTLAGSGLVTLGVHTVNHYALSKLTPERVQREAADARARVRERTGLDPVHFCYPYGDRCSAAGREFALIRELGFASATTTRKGVLFPEHAQHLHALPRVSLNGNYQRLHYVRTFLTGAPFALSNGLRRLDVQ
jgi:peptidoglycan/xylan/chitin deacetylase (PgdA/CDA1 family)